MWDGVQSVASAWQALVLISTVTKLSKTRSGCQLCGRISPDGQLVQHQLEVVVVQNCRLEARRLQGPQADLAQSTKCNILCKEAQQYGPKPVTSNVSMRHAAVRAGKHGSLPINLS
eukprot:scaffold454_cov124-Isochrysis_galbana.AAC.4